MSSTKKINKSKIFVQNPYKSWNILVTRLGHIKLENTDMQTIKIQISMEMRFVSLTTVYPIKNNIVTCQVHLALVKRVQCTVSSSFLNFWVVITRSGLVHLLTDQRIPGPVSCCCLEPGWFVGDPTPLAHGNIYVIWVFCTWWPLILPFKCKCTF